VLHMQVNAISTQFDKLVTQLEQLKHCMTGLALMLTCGYDVVQLADIVQLDTKKSLTSAQDSGPESFFSQTLQRLECVRKMDRQMSVRMTKIVIRSVCQYSLLVVFDIWGAWFLSPSD